MSQQILFFGHKSISVKRGFGRKKFLFKEKRVIFFLAEALSQATKEREYHEKNLNFYDIQGLQIINFTRNLYENPNTKRGIVFQEDRKVLRGFQKQQRGYVIEDAQASLQRARLSRDILAPIRAKILSLETETRDLQAEIKKKEEEVGEVKERMENLIIKIMGITKEIKKKKEERSWVGETIDSFMGNKEIDQKQSERETLITQLGKMREQYQEISPPLASFTLFWSKNGDDDLYTSTLDKKDIWLFRNPEEYQFNSITIRMQKNTISNRDYYIDTLESDIAKKERSIASYKKQIKRKERQANIPDLSQKTAAIKKQEAYVHDLGLLLRFLQTKPR